MSQSLVSIQNFLGIQNSSGTNTVYGDIKELIRLNNLQNNQVLGSFMQKKEIVSADTFQYEYAIYPQVNKFDETQVQADNMIRDKVTVVFGDDNWLETGYKIDVRTKRSMSAWGLEIANQESKMFLAKSDQDNLIAVEMIYNYALASGRFKIAPNLDSLSTATTKEQISDAIADCAQLIETIVRTRTEVNAGLEDSRLNYIFSGYVANNFVRAANYMNTGDKSFETFLSGSLSRIYGKGYSTSIYLDSLSTKTEGLNNVKTYDFTGLLGIVYAIDNFTVYTKEWTELGIDGWQIIPGKKASLAREVTWKTMGIISPSREHLQYVFLRSAPTLVQINAARTWLVQQQPALYKNYATAMTNEQYNAVIVNAANFRFAGAPDIPQDGVPATTNKNVKEQLSDKEIRKQAEKIVEGNK